MTTHTPSPAQSTAPAPAQPTAITSPEHRAFLAVQKLAADLTVASSALLKSAGLSGPQYNVLRILRGAGEGRTCGEISAELINRDPDVTRLLDRLEAAGLVTRTRERRDRRVVTSRISEAGLDLLARLDGPNLDVHRQQFAHLPPQRLALLLELLEEATHPEAAVSPDVPEVAAP
ncbi:MarR family winged helix-turn-helix transcriptional regulator [Deinococcus aquiradiocola]|uniref:HTH marR-type domain-containing protein n=1 Tax=Deinococcus aquiradiocola TaxID=393059 RepID=A0A917PJN3_9DEIO|nr:MarR family winged helix-turn-helix transcriptional regulator [Deinococcus aquiradiocola]GGJ82049.1 hypothetical protein GCM10008939_27430 [Deinococcus aquiradiocola]